MLKSFEESVFMGQALVIEEFVILLKLFGHIAIPTLQEGFTRSQVYC